MFSGKCVLHEVAIGSAGVAYPGGGGVYGDQTCMPLPDAERINNPNISG